MSFAACVQQSVMNFGILMIQGLVNSFGTRVILAYAISPAVGVVGIWWSIPIGWLLADIVGAVIMRRSLKTIGDT